MAPSLLAADFSRLPQEIAAVEAGGADLLHLDVMDGRFVSDLTMGPVVVRGIRKLTRLFLDAHLMIHEPARMAGAFRDAGCESITVSAEACADLGASIATVRQTGAHVGLALSPATPLTLAMPHLADIDVLLLMTVVPGRGGQAFMPEMCPKIEAAANQRQAKGLDFVIEVDGGITPETAVEVKRYGAEVLVAGTSIFRHPPYAAAIEALRGASG